MRRVARPKTELILIIALAASPFGLSAKGKAKTDATPQDRIDVLANLPVAGGPVVRVTTAQHFSRSYLYLEHASHAITLVDVTDAQHPSVAGNLDLPAGERGSVLAAAGDAALISSDTAQPSTTTKTMSIVSFANPAHPQTVRQFANVTSSTADDRRGLIFVTNDEGIWILHRNPAQDPEVQERYAHEIRYNQ